MRLFWSFMLGSGLSSLITFVAMPVYTRLLAPDEFGYFDLANTIATVAAALIYADIWVGVMRLALRGSDFDRWIKPGLALFGASTVVLSLGAVATWVIADPRDIWWVLLATVARSAAQFWGFAARGVGFVRLFAISGVVNAAVTFAASVLALQWLSMGSAALFLGIALGCLSQVLLVEARVGLLRRAWRSGAPAWSSVLFRFTVPLGINSVAFWLFTSTGRFVVAIEMGLDANGIFAAASKLAGLVAVVSGVVTLVWQQLSFEGQSKESSFYRKGTAFAALLYGVGGVFAVPLGTWFYQVTVDDRYALGWVTVPGFLLVAVLAGYSNFVGNIFYGLERTVELFISTLVCLAVVGVATFPLVRELGINGANLALVLGYVTNIGTRHLILNRRLGLWIPMRNAWIATFGVLLSSYLVIVYGVVPALSVAVVYSALFGWWSLRFGGIRTRESSRMRGHDTDRAQEILED
ncbi:lipopolysaccharide biosynthesis protein [Microbacterium sp. YY-03]|uniref:lipopolysaccharide biosynthesis protein n=1 Tax=Microbacterium sp. YY-03 TaxID=3421636 RepID=UPI003D16AF68